MSTGHYWKECTRLKDMVWRLKLKLIRPEKIDMQEVHVDLENIKRTIEFSGLQSCKIENIAEIVNSLHKEISIYCSYVYTAKENAKEHTVRSTELWQNCLDMVENCLNNYLIKHEEPVHVFVIGPGGAEEIIKDLSYKPIGEKIKELGFSLEKTRIVMDEVTVYENCPIGMLSGKKVELIDVSKEVGKIIPRNEFPKPVLISGEKRVSLQETFIIGRAGKGERGRLVVRKFPYSITLEKIMRKISEDEIRDFVKYFTLNEKCSPYISRIHGIIYYDNGFFYMDVSENGTVLMIGSREEIMESGRYLFYQKGAPSEKRLSSGYHEISLFDNKITLTIPK